jgi:8-oxo-dGTP pyrophosphatase MutT (NUDIX family)
MYKVFFNDSFLILAEQDYNPAINVGTTIFKSYTEIKEWLVKAENSVLPLNAIYQTNDLEKVWNEFCSTFRIIEAAGGLVINNDKKYLCIFRRGKWDLPKGKLDKNETPEKAAIREVQEETGLKEISILKHITNTFHIYRLKGNLVLKRTFWYSMKNNGSDKLVAQTEEDIEKVLWLNANEINPLVSNMFGSVKDVIHQAGILI